MGWLRIKDGTWADDCPSAYLQFFRWSDSRFWLLIKIFFQEPARPSASASIKAASSSSQHSLEQEPSLPPPMVIIGSHFGPSSWRLQNRKPFSASVSVSKVRSQTRFLFQEGSLISASYLPHGLLLSGVLYNGPGSVTPGQPWSRKSLTSGSGSNFTGPGVARSICLSLMSRSSETETQG